MLAVVGAEEATVAKQMKEDPSESAKAEGRAEGVAVPAEVLLVELVGTKVAGAKAERGAVMMRLKGAVMQVWAAMAAVAAVAAVGMAAKMGKGEVVLKARVEGSAVGVVVPAAFAVGKQVATKGVGAPVEKVVVQVVVARVRVVAAVVAAVPQAAVA